MASQDCVTQHDRKYAVCMSQRTRYSRYHPADLRFWSKVDKSKIDGCWLWIGNKNKYTGYGNFFDNGKRWRAHRWIAEKVHGPIPEGFHVDHLCHTLLCVRPDHLRVVEPWGNVVENSRHPKMVTHLTRVCQRGHDLTDPSSYYEWTSKKTGYTMRRCKACRRNRDRERVKSRG